VTTPVRTSAGRPVGAPQLPRASERRWRSWLARLLPRSLFGRLVAILASGLLIAQLLSAAINLAERESLLLTSGGMQQAHRIADVVRLLDPMAPAERERIVAVLNVPPLVLSLRDAPSEPTGAGDAVGAPWPARRYQAMLQAMLDGEHDVRVETASAADAGAAWSRSPGHMRGPGMMGPGMMGGAMRGSAPGWTPGTALLRTQVQLRDGRWARFDSVAPEVPEGVPWRLVLTLAVLLVAVLVLSFLAVRWVTRPLKLLATAADELGRDLHRPPLPETGPLEIRHAARAFNTMQARLVRFVEDRTRILAAMSHDLKTPITRMRLRAELLDDDEARERFEADLAEMQAMVQQTLDFMRGLGGGEAAQALDFNALLAQLQADQRSMGRDVRVEGRAAAPLPGIESLLRRCLGNLVDNAVLYGTSARIAVEDTGAAVSVRVRDRGPGIPEDELQQVFEPFYRLEASRNRATGGTGLGLTIARNIAQTHGGDITLHNRPEGGLEAVLTLPREPAPG
jgi:signal transduction histidine kinase